MIQQRLPSTDRYTQPTGAGLSIAIFLLSVAMGYLGVVFHCTHMEQPRRDWVNDNVDGSRRGRHGGWDIVRDFGLAPGNDDIVFTCD